MSGKWRKLKYSFRELPSPLEVISELAVFVLVEEVGFFYTHIALHSLVKNLLSNNGQKLKISS